MLDGPREISFPPLAGVVALAIGYSQPEVIGTAVPSIYSSVGLTLDLPLLSFLPDSCSFQKTRSHDFSSQLPQKNACDRVMLRWFAGDSETTFNEEALRAGQGSPRGKTYRA